MKEVTKTSKKKLKYVAPVATVMDVYLDQNVLQVEASVTIDRGSEDAGDDWMQTF